MQINYAENISCIHLLSQAVYLANGRNAVLKMYTVVVQPSTVTNVRQK